MTIQPHHTKSENASRLGSALLLVMFGIVLVWSFMARVHFLDLGAGIHERENFTLRLFSQVSAGMSIREITSTPTKMWLPVHIVPFGLLFRFLNNDLVSLRLVHVGIFYFSALMLFLVVRRLGGYRAGLISVMCYLMMPGAIVESIVINRYVLMTGLNLLVLYLMMIDKPFPAGVVFGYNLVLFPANIILFPCVWMLKKRIKIFTISCVLSALFFLLLCPDFPIRYYFRGFDTHGVSILARMLNPLLYPYIPAVLYYACYTIGLFLFIPFCYFVFKNRFSIFHMWLIGYCVLAYADSWRWFFNSYCHMYHYFPLCAIAAGIIGVGLGHDGNRTLSNV